MGKQSDPYEIVNTNHYLCLVEKKMNNYFLEISYKGTAYHGWQIQENAISVQQKLNEALTVLLRKDMETIGAGRTDTGVHAKQLFVQFSASAKILENPDRFVHSLNALLPFDIAVKKLINVHQQAHARFDATTRSYEYHLHFNKDPFLQDFSWQLRDIPAVDIMNKAAEDLLGRQDFSCFSKSNTQVFTNFCHIHEAKWVWKDESLIFNITADRFLRNMVRAIVGTLLEIGFKKKPAGYIKEVIKSQDRSKAGSSVPASGLYLTKVLYPYIDN